jgi:hypothetical protein
MVQQRTKRETLPGTFETFCRCLPWTPEIRRNIVTGPLDGKRILILATNGFEQSELEVPRAKLKAAGATVEVASPETGPLCDAPGTYVFQE